MGKVLKRLQLQFFLILWIIYSGVKAAPYSKYGRTCRDIGCLPREVCVMSYDTCSFNQQEGTNCGRYPTCTKADKVQQPPSQSAGTSVLNPSQENPRSSNTENNQPARDGINPNSVFGFPSNANYPHMNPAQIPLDIPRLPDNRQPFPSMPRDAQSFGFHHPDLTPPPNVFAPYRPPQLPTTTANPNFLDQFFTGKQQRNYSTINKANLNLTLLSLLFLLIYRVANKCT